MFSSSYFSLIASFHLITGACLTPMLCAQTEVVAEIDQSETSKNYLQQTQVKGLLVIQLANGKFAGTASQMNATVVTKPKTSRSTKFKIGYNQAVGKMMTGANVEVDKFIRVRYADKLPNDMSIEFSFADKYSPKDGPSAGVVCALMVDSILSGDEIDPGFAATGAMTATGEVQPVGGVPSKIKGAVRKKCTHVAIPVKNKGSITDAYILKGIESLYKTQIFTIETFEEARALALLNRDENTQNSIKEFSSVMEVLEKNESYLYNKKVKEKLRNIVKLTPNHLSARLLYLHSVKKQPKSLSLSGSITGIDNAGSTLSRILDNKSFLTQGGFGDDKLSDLVSELNRLRPMLDKRTIKYADSYIDVSRFIKRHRARKTWNDQLRRELNALATSIHTERNALTNNEDIMEELLDQ